MISAFWRLRFFYTYVLYQELGRDCGPLVAKSLNSVIFQPAMANRTNFNLLRQLRVVPHWLKGSPEERSWERPGGAKRAKLNPSDPAGLIMKHVQWHHLPKKDIFF